METGYVAKKAARRSRRLCPVPSERHGLPRFARAPKFRTPRNPRTADRSVRRGISCDPSLGNRQSPKDHSTKEENGLRLRVRKELMSFPINLCALVVRCSGQKNLFVDSEQLVFSRLDPFFFFVE